MTTVSPLRGRATGLIGRRREGDVLDRLLQAVGGGESRVLVLHGEPGAGKTALLDSLADRASAYRVVRAVGIQSEMELAYAALHQLCSPMLDRLDHLPVPQRDALRTAFGLSPGPVPDRFMVGLAVLSLFSDMADEQPLICIVDDEQWIDRASAQTLAFVARRLEAESVGLVFAARGLSDEVAGLPQLVVEGLSARDAGTLLDSALTGPLDPRVRDRILAETRGNPLALLELPQALTPAELAGGFGLPGNAPLSGRIEAAFQRRLDALPADSRGLLLIAAAEPVGDPVLVWRVADRLGIGVEAATPIAAAGLVDFGPRLLFRHPIVRSVAYRSASLQERQKVHGALAEFTDPGIDPDRRAWHRAQAAPGPDEEVAEELVRSASRAQARGGLAAASAFLEHAATLTPEPTQRATRLFAAARAKRDAGALDAALGLLVAVEAGPLDPLQAAEVERLRGQIAWDQQRVGDAARLLHSAGRRLEPFDAASARETLLEALRAAIWSAGLPGSTSVREVAKAARSAPPGPTPPRGVDVRLDAFAVRVTEGYAAAAPLLTRALDLSLTRNEGIDQPGRGRWLAESRASDIIALELWDAESLHALADHQVRFARDTGALVQLQFALNFLAGTILLAGELSTSAQLIQEDRQIAEATGNPPFEYASMIFEAWRGREPEASDLIEGALQDATSRDLGRKRVFAAYAQSLLYNGLGRHVAARDAALPAFESDQLGLGPFVLPELGEAASRTGDSGLVRAALAWLAERTRVTPSDWSLGIEARLRAFLAEGDDVDDLYRQSISRLGSPRLRAQLARTHLLYGEWLRRQRRRLDARVQLRIAHGMLDEMGIEAFAERARRELLATGETARRRSVETSDELTAQEIQIAGLARDGLSNPEIGARLFISPRTVQYHLRKVFTKLDIGSRNQLDRALPRDLETGRLR
jgi:DNA-binding CsgD family transcriptional regulator